MSGYVTSPSSSTPAFNHFPISFSMTPSRTLRRSVARSTPWSSISKELPDIDLEDPTATHPYDPILQRFQTVVLRPPRTKAIRAVEKLLLVDRGHDHRNRPLQDLVLEGRDSQRPLLRPTSLWDVDSPDIRCTTVPCPGAALCSAGSFRVQFPDFLAPTAALRLPAFPAKMLHALRGRRDLPGSWTTLVRVPCSRTPVGRWPRPCRLRPVSPASCSAILPSTWTIVSASTTR